MTIFFPTSRVRVFFLMLGDWMTFYCCLWVPVLAGHTPENPFPACGIIWQFPFWGILLVVVNAVCRLYYGNWFHPGMQIGLVEELRRLFYATAGIFFVMYCYYAKDAQWSMPLRWCLEGWILTFLLLPVVRQLFRSLMNRKMHFTRTLALAIGAGRDGENVARALNSKVEYALQIVAFFDDDPEKIGGKCGDVPVIGAIAEAVAYGREHQIDYAIVTLPYRMLRVVARNMAGHFRHVLLIPDTRIFSALWVSPVDVEGCLGLEVHNQLLLPEAAFLKICMDKLVAIVLLVLLLPLFAVIAILVKFSGPGPIFYRAERLGRGGKPFQMWKFRTMRDKADAELQELLQHNPTFREEWARSFKLRNDPRITWIGRILRKTSLDEMPQLWNVFKGEMSVIGPRPIVESEIQYYGKDYETFASVRPGITGLWQISGRSSLPYDVRVSLDLYYIMNWSVWLDLHIMLRTVQEVLACRGAF